MACELGSTRWKLAFAVGLGQRPRLVQIPARDLRRLRLEIRRARQRFGCAADVPVFSCYEAGRDGFWVHRALTADGVRNVVVDPSSIAVDRRARRVKTDRLDAVALVTQLIHAVAGDRRGWREVRVPTLEDEMDRQLHRERETVRDARRAVGNRIQGLLVAQGVALRIGRRGPAALADVRLWDGSPLPTALRERVEREWAQFDALSARLHAVEQRLHARLTQRDDVVARQTRQMRLLDGIGEVTGEMLSTELFAWRAFRNGGQVGAIVGLTPTPYRSDQSAREQGISHSGNRRVRVLLVEAAWRWLRYQPSSSLTRWYRARFGTHGRARKIGIVALARKLVVALWRWVDQGVIPEGARVRA